MNQMNRHDMHGENSALASGELRQKRNAKKSFVLPTGSTCCVDGVR